LILNNGRHVFSEPTQWINEGLFFGSPDEIDPLAGPNDGSGQFTIPKRPIRRRLCAAGASRP
jgi:hypothetical protein